MNRTGQQEKETGGSKDKKGKREISARAFQNVSPKIHPISRWYRCEGEVTDKRGAESAPGNFSFSDGSDA